MRVRNAPLMVAALLVSFTLAAPASAKAPGPNGRIAYNVFDVLTGTSRVWTSNPDGSHATILADRHLEQPHWSPDGTQILGLGSALSGEENIMALIINVHTGVARELVMSDPTNFEIGCAIWSPDGTRLTCWAMSGPEPDRNGIYTIRASDGGGLVRITSNPGGEDAPGDYSPSGNRLVFARVTPDGSSGLYVKTIGGGPAQRITPPGLEIDGEGLTWSPGGSRIVFSAREDEAHRYAVFLVAPDGSHLHRMDLPCGGPLSSVTAVDCRQPDWSPDGTTIMFSRGSISGRYCELYSVRPDGTGFTRITYTPTTFNNMVDWGTHPIAG
jgi:Tol biopolymer transport system component